MFPLPQNNHIRPVVHFSKQQLNDFSFSGSRELLLVNASGSYFSTTISGCNTRKYHGCLVAAQPQIDDQNHVLISSLDESIFIAGKQLQLAVRQYPGILHPEGHQLLQDFSYEEIPKWRFASEEMEIDKEVVLCRKEDRLLIRYAVRRAVESLVLRVQPLLACRGVHATRQADTALKVHAEQGKNGTRVKMYREYSPLHFQFSKALDFISHPDWYYNIEYLREMERGYDFREALFTPGCFEVRLKQGDELFFSAATEEASVRGLKKKFESEKRSVVPVKTFEDCLRNAAQQFIVSRKKRTEVVAGYHWFGRWGRDTFIALPGLTLATDRPRVFKAVIDSSVKELRNGLFPNTGSAAGGAYNSADAPLWFIWALQQYVRHTGSIRSVWNLYGSKIIAILSHYRKGTLYGIRMEKNGLVRAGERGHAVTWMDAVVDGKPVTPRIGFPVEINALWYNAVCFAVEGARAWGDDVFLNYWEEIPPAVRSSFRAFFWDEKKGHLADYVGEDYTDWSVRPNQVFSLSLPYSPLDEQQMHSVLNIVDEELLTPRGLRTLSPRHPRYKGEYAGDHRTRDLAYHQGTVWPWLLEHYAEACVRVRGAKGAELVRSLYENFAQAVSEYGLGTIPELCQGDAPHLPCGAISQAWSVSALLRVKQLLDRNPLAAEPPARELVNEIQSN